MRLVPAVVCALPLLGCAYGVRGGAIATAQTPGPVAAEGLVGGSLGAPFGNAGKEALSLAGVMSVGPSLSERGPRGAFAFGPEYRHTPTLGERWGMRAALLGGARGSDVKGDANGTLVASFGLLHRIAYEYVKEPGKLAGSHQYTSLAIDAFAGWAFRAGDGAAHDPGAIFGLGVLVEFDRLDQFDLYFH